MFQRLSAVQPHAEKSRFSSIEGAYLNTTVQSNVLTLVREADLGVNQPIL